MTAIDPVWREAAAALVIGAAGAAVFWMIGFPAAMLTGPATAVSVATVLGVRCTIPPLLRDGVFILIGVSIGSTVTPEVIATAMAWPLSLAVLMVTLVLVLVIAMIALERVFRFDRMTAMLSATPGHLSYVLGLSTEMGADVARVALVQSIRVLLLTLVVPVLVALWGVEGTASLQDRGHIAPWAIALIFPLAIMLGLGLQRLHVPAPLVLGAMAVSALGQGADITPGALPDGLIGAAFVAMGALIGTRFVGVDRGALAGALLAGLVCTLIACGVAAVGAVLVSGVLGLPPAVLLLAFAPGGVEVMAAIAIETGLEPAFVAAHHVFRLLALTVIVPVMVIWARRS